MRYIYGHTGEHCLPYFIQPLWFIAEVVGSHYRVIKWFSIELDAKKEFELLSEKEELEKLRKENAELKAQLQRLPSISPEKALEICRSWAMTDAECEELMR